VTSTKPSFGNDRGAGFFVFGTELHGLRASGYQRNCMDEPSEISNGFLFSVCAAVTLAGKMPQ